MISGFSKYAIQCHKDTNHLYDDYLPYEFHLKMAVSKAYKFMHLIQEESVSMQTVIICACWGHDLIEDARQNYSDICETSRIIYFNNYIPHSFSGEPYRDIADIIYAVSNEKGKNRKERESDKYFEGIRNTPYATFVKLCDRIANIEYSKMTAWHSDAKLKMYEKEHPRFKSQLYDEKYKQMWDYMDDLFELEKLIPPTRIESGIKWKMPSNKADERIFCDGHLRAGYLESDLKEALNFIEMITRAPIAKESDDELNKQAEQFLKKFKS